MEVVDKLYSTTLQSHPVTHSRLKFLSELAQTSKSYFPFRNRFVGIKSSSDYRWSPTISKEEEVFISESYVNHII